MAGTTGREAAGFFIRRTRGGEWVKETRPQDDPEHRVRRTENRQPRMRLGSFRRKLRGRIDCQRRISEARPGFMPKSYTARIIARQPICYRRLPTDARCFTLVGRRRQPGNCNDSPTPEKVGQFSLRRQPPRLPPMSRRDYCLHRNVRVAEMARCVRGSITTHPSPQLRARRGKVRPIIHGRVRSRKPRPDPKT